MIRDLTNEEMKRLYGQHMKNDFPSNELKPLAEILKQRKQGLNFCLGFVCGDQLCGYAVIEKNEGNRCLLLDYFAILPEYRQSGKGTLFLSELKQTFSPWNALLIESETAINETAKKRLRFYQKAGARITAIRLRLFFVDYHVLVLDCAKALNDAEAKKALMEIYETIYSPVFRRCFLSFPLDKTES